MVDQHRREAITRLTTEQRDCLLMVSELLSSKEIARKLNISPTTVDNRLKRAQTILGVTTRADAAKLLIHELQANQTDIEVPCVSLADQSLALVKRRYSRNSRSASGVRDSPLGDGDRVLEDSGITYLPTSFSFETLPPSWLSMFVRGDVDNDLTVPARMVMIMLLMITLSLSMAVLVVLAEGLSRFS